MTKLLTSRYLLTGVTGLAEGRSSRIAARQRQLILAVRSRIGLELLRPVEMPSRLDACFACPTREDADKYRLFNDQNFQQVLHEVELVDPTGSMWVACHF